MRWIPVAVLAACAVAPSRMPGSGDDSVLPPDRERDYAIWLGGAQVGTAHETERWSRTGVMFSRTEAMRFLRGDVLVAIATVIEITADRALAPSHVSWTEHAQTTRHAEARRDAAGWTVTDATGTLAARLPAAAIPAELAPLIVRRDGRFAGPVFLPARGFIAGAGRIEPFAPRRLIAQLTVDASGNASSAGPAASLAPARATAEATIDLGDDAMPVRVVDGEGVIATRITAAEAALAFTPVDLIAATSIPLTGTPGERSTAVDAAPSEVAAIPPTGEVDSPVPRSRVMRSTARSRDVLFGPRAARPTGESSGAMPRSRAVDPVGESSGAPPGSRASRIVLDADLAIPPVPGQAAQTTPDGIEVTLSPWLRGGLPRAPTGPDRTREIITLVANVHRRIAPNLAAAPTMPRAAAVATAGDCTTFALAYAALARARGIPTQLVTGFRIDGDRLVRHRWAISWTGGAWIPVDAAFGAVPAGGDLVGVAVHPPDDLGLLAGEAALTRVRAAHWK